MVDNKSMLERIFGNKTAEKVLLHIFHYGESHASAIAQEFKMVLNPVVAPEAYDDLMRKLKALS